MPVLSRRQDETIYLIIPTKVSDGGSSLLNLLKWVYLQDIKFMLNAQHDCQSSHCEASGERLVVQERVETTILQKVIRHKPTERYIINMAALHNAHLLRQVLPRYLTKPLPLLSNREETHHRLAQKLRDAREKTAKKKDAEKSEAAKKKAAEKRRLDLEEARAREDEEIDEDAEMFEVGDDDTEDDVQVETGRRAKRRRQR